MMRSHKLFQEILIAFHIVFVSLSLSCVHTKLVNKIELRDFRNNHLNKIVRGWIIDDIHRGGWVNEQFKWCNACLFSCIVVGWTTFTYDAARVNYVIKFTFYSVEGFIYCEMLRHSRSLRDVLRVLSHKRRLTCLDNWISAFLSYLMLFFIKLLNDEL